MIEQLTPKIYNEEKGEWQCCCKYDQMPDLTNGTDGLNPGTIIADEKEWQCCCGLMYDTPGLKAQQQKEINKVVANIVIYMGIKGGAGMGIFFTPRQRWLALHGTRKQRKKWMNAYVRKGVRWCRRVKRTWCA